MSGTRLLYSREFFCKNPINDLIKKKLETLKQKTIEHEFNFYGDILSILILPA